MQSSVGSCFAFKRRYQAGASRLKKPQDGQPEDDRRQRLAASVTHRAHLAKLTTFDGFCKPNEAQSPSEPPV